MTISKICEKDCSICYACYNVCNNNSISMELSENGFYYPKIDESKCTQCNLCEKVCPLNKTRVSAKPLKFYGSKNNDEQIRLSSSSGGIFYNLGKSIIDDGGVVFGAIFDENLKVISSCAEDILNLQKMQGSKYVQIDIGKNFKNVKKQLDFGKRVLYSGCPCQIAGLKSYLMKDYENLITVDFICHGSPSPMIFKAYLESLEERYQSSAKKVYFRNKKLGWNKFSFVVEFENGQEFSQIFYQNFYMRGFLRNFYEKESCHNCKFKGLTSGSDIVISDFWGSDELYPEFDDNKGLSSIIINTKKGDQLFNSIQSEFEVFEISYSDIFKRNRYISESVPMNTHKEAFYKEYYKNGIEKSMKKYLSDDVKTKIKNKIKKFLYKK